MEERERKFLVGPQQVEELTRGKTSLLIEQNYLSEEGAGDELRLRRGTTATPFAHSEFTATLKGGAGEIRSELEVGLDREAFYTLAGRRTLASLAKLRYVIDERQGVTLDILTTPKRPYSILEIEQ